MFVTGLYQSLPVCDDDDDDDERSFYYKSSWKILVSLFYSKFNSLM